MNSTQHNKTTGLEAEEIDFYQKQPAGTIEVPKDPRPVTRGGMQARKQAFRDGRLITLAEHHLGGGMQARKQAFRDGEAQLAVETAAIEAEEAKAAAKAEAEADAKAVAEVKVAAAAEAEAAAAAALAAATPTEPEVDPFS